MGYTSGFVCGGGVHRKWISGEGGGRFNAVNHARKELSRITQDLVPEVRTRVTELSLGRFYFQRRARTHTKMNSTFINSLAIIMQLEGHPCEPIHYFSS